MKYQWQVIIPQRIGEFYYYWCRHEWSVYVTYSLPMICVSYRHLHVDGLVQDCSNSSALTVDMMTSSDQMETFSALLAICAGNSPVPGEFPTQRPVTRSFDIFFDLRQNKRLRKQSWGWWFETRSRPLWRHCNGYCSLALILRYMNGSTPISQSLSDFLN